MKKISSLFLMGFIWFPSLLFCQTILEPNPSINSNFSFNQLEVVGYSMLTNNSEDTVSYTWTRNIVQMTEGWSCAICDINLCYLDFVSSQTFTLLPEAQGNLDVHVYPNGIPGNAIVELHVVDNDDETNHVMGLYYFDQALSAPVRLTQNIKTYPNPVVDMLNIEAGHKVSRIEIFNIEGRRMMAERINGNGNVNLSGLPSGTFIMRMYDIADVQISGNLLIKQ